MGRMVDGRKGRVDKRLVSLRKVVRERKRRVGGKISNSSRCHVGGQDDKTVGIGALSMVLEFTRG